jgi:uncharacterized surface protein with fasciclin (FAS1) repeats
MASGGTSLLPRLSLAVLSLTLLSQSLANPGVAAFAALDLRLQAITQRHLIMNNPVTNVRATNLIDTAVANGSFKTLCKALDAAELTHVLRGSGPYTVFAPTDEAFGKLPQGTLENWLKPENKAELISMLKYHVLPGRASAADVGRLSHPKMMHGQSSNISEDDGHLTIDGAHLVGEEIASSNGVIHTIDAVITPLKLATKH